MIRYTEDKWGALVFPIDTDLTKLNFDNCFVAIGTLSAWVFPFTRLNKYIQEYENFGKFLQGKHNYYYLDGKVSDRTYHYACKNKFNFITGSCHERVNRYDLNSCSGFEVEKKFSFRWHKAICQYIAPVYADMKGKARRKMYFEELCPTKEVELLNRKKLSERGKRAGLSRTIKSKCGGCMYDVSCSERWKQVDKNCFVSRKMMNRKVRSIAQEKFGSFEAFLELYRYADTKCADFKVSFPISKKCFIVQTSDHEYYQNTRYSRVVANRVTKNLIKNPITPILENNAKVFLLFLHLCGKSPHNVLLDPNSKLAHVQYRLAYVKNGTKWFSIHKYDLKNFSDVIAKFGTMDKEEMFKAQKNKGCL